MRENGVWEGEFTNYVNMKGDTVQKGKIIIEIDVKGDVVTQKNIFIGPDGTKSDYIGIAQMKLKGNRLF